MHDRVPVDNDMVHVAEGDLTMVHVGIRDQAMQAMKVSATWAMLQ